MPKQTPAKLNFSPIGKAKSSEMKIKTIIFAPSETFSLQHQRNTARSEKSTKTKTTPKQAMREGGKSQKISKRFRIKTSELVKKLLREEKRKKREKEEGGRKKKYQERPQST